MPTMSSHLAVPSVAKCQGKFLPSITKSLEKLCQVLAHSMPESVINVTVQGRGARLSWAFACKGRRITGVGLSARCPSTIRPGKEGTEAATPPPPPARPPPPCHGPSLRPSPSFLFPNPSASLAVRQRPAHRTPM